MREAPGEVEVSFRLHNLPGCVGHRIGAMPPKRYGKRYEVER
jgi:hypothetical protein